ncbi:MAG: NAD(+) synthase [bacterium]|nr:NAD(+) synthase [bacterium]
MKNLTGLTIAMCQMPVLPGQPRHNIDYMIEEMRAAEEREADFIVFPEMVDGYLKGDLYDDKAYLRDVARQNDRFCQATLGKRITAIFGSTDITEGKVGEDGRLRKSNAALVARNGQWLHRTHKFLQPNYRFFDDDRYFFSLRKKLMEQMDRARCTEKSAPDIHGLFPVFEVETRIGALRAGIILCEDMWHEDYAFNPTQYLMENGAELIFNLSASPWGWQKNRKRHRVVKKLLDKNPAWFCYVNNTGLQNNGKNLIVFDGSSTLYNPDGRIVFEIPPYRKGTCDVVLSGSMPALAELPQDDTKEMYLAIRCAIHEFFQAFPPERRVVLIGLSGGIDSSLSAALFTDVLGPENVIGVHMPFTFTQTDSTNLAKQVAENLGIHYVVKPIHGIVKAICEATGAKPGTLSYQNVQARARMEVLAAMAQDMGGVFSANWNKVEGGQGYGTLYADIAGALAILGDLVKREEYQLAEYLNRAVYGREVIPRECFEKIPTAELADAQQDPFDYGNLERRGYHDEMIRAFTEFRKNPEWFLECFLLDSLETELKLEKGTLRRLFPIAQAFVTDLENQWRQFFGSYFKRVQAPPVVVVSKRAFGFDLRESMLSPYFTDRYYELKKKVESRDAQNS